MRPEQRNVKKFIGFVLLILCVLTMGYSAWRLIGYNLESRQSERTVEELTALRVEAMETPMREEPRIEAPRGSEKPLPGAPPATLPPMKQDEDRQEVSAGLLALREKNVDCIGWITIEGTPIDYPVMYRPNQADYYLHRDFYGNPSSAGSVYLAEICDPEASDNLILYGHHMNSGKMFAALERYKKKSFYDEHRCIRFETLHGRETYEVIAALTTPVYTGHDFAFYRFATAKDAGEFDAYVAQCQARALYDTGRTAAYGDRLLTLATCEYSQKNGRMLVIAKRIDPASEEGEDETRQAPEN